MRTHSRLPASNGDVIKVYGANGGLISTVIVTDPKAGGHVPGHPGYECRDATPSEIQTAEKANQVKHVYG